ncbi:Peroxidase [Mycena venus]|uniref:Peroxidase n=1 Tax=Mycena venus TaxID=2733690 RepID=A0A8H7DBP8_9AGAR|nr:Peroxidase [Mycena venus]
MLTLALLVSTSLASVQAYVWPSPQLDALEAMRWDQNRFGIAPLIRPCDLFIFGPANSGRSNAADWIRTAYHDMATYNITDGTGGMDASIRFAAEQARPENAGDGFANTLNVLQPVSNRYVSSLLTSLTLIRIAAAQKLPSRGGRLDAAVPNQPGVPEPQEGLDSHVASFSRQGFTKEEMIGLVACGHTFGGVQHATFPTIVPDLHDSNNVDSVAHFDTTNTHFDNNVATEYISGTTLNPLVVGLNDTTNSDKRIFGSDGNATMEAFAQSPDLFASTCANLFARMLDTVPKGVQLTDVITPLPVKPNTIKLIYDALTETIAFSGEVRLWDVPANLSRVVRMLWDDRSGSTSTANNITLSTGSIIPIGSRHTATWYFFNLFPLSASSGVSSIRFVVDGKLEDQQGKGFAVNDDLVFANSSCSMPADGTGTFDVAVRKDVAPTRVYLEQTSRDSTSRPIIVEIDMTPKPVDSSKAYAIWSANVSSTFESYTIGAEVGGVKITRGLGMSLNQFGECSS